LDIVVDDGHHVEVVNRKEKTMHEELVRMVAQKTGLAEDKARSATDTVIGYLKEKLPSTVASQLDAAAGGASSNLGDMAKGVGAKFTGRE
jgi:hypothetical protein